MENNKFAIAMNKMQGAVKTAFATVGKAAGEQPDPDLRLYATLQPKDFEKIAQEFGADATIEYIKKMEARRLIGGNHA